ncbi:MAG TPA: GAF domain-containing protein, partial [Roseiflexaceae bacterium]|nr:GAF domain-containing protein [Roseiflexaceae bacterium]
DRQRPTRKSVDQLEIFADQAAIAIENSRLFAERERQIAELDALSQVSHVTGSALQLRPMGEGIYHVLHEMLGADGISLALFNRQRHQAHLLVIDHDEVVLDETRELTPELDTATMAGWIVRNNQPLLLDDIEQAQSTYADLQPMFVGDNERSHSYLGIPLTTHDGTPIGALGISSRRRRAFDKRDEQFLISAGAQVSLGVQNVVLFAQANEQVEHMRLLNHVSSVAASTLKIDDIFHATLAAMVRVVGADQGRLVLYDRAAGEGSIAAEYIPTKVPERVRIPLNDNPSIEWLDQNQRPLVAIDAQNDPRLTRSLELFRSLDIRSIMLIPLIVGDEVIGSIGIDTVGHHQRFGDQDIGLCQTIANQTATAIQNARLFEEARTNAQALQSKVGELST